MLDNDLVSILPRIGEIVVVSCSNSDNWSFLHTICDNYESTDQHAILGQITINDQLFLFLYGINSSKNLEEFAWDLIVNKMLGYIILYEWTDSSTFTSTLETIDFLTERIDAPLIVAADIGKEDFPVDISFFNDGITISSHTKFTFCRSDDSNSVKSVIRMLIDMLIEKM